MEPLTLSTALLVALFISLPLIFFLLTSKGSSKLPPGNRGWPIVGETLDFFNTGLKGSPESFVLSRMRKYSPQVFKTSLVGATCAVFCGAAGNKFLFSNEDKLVRVWFPHSFRKIFPISTDTEPTRRLRVFIKSFLKTENLERYLGIMDTVAKGQIATYKVHKKEVLASTLAQHYTFAAAAKLFLSLEDLGRIETLVNAFTVVRNGILSVPVNFPGTPLNRAIKASKFLRDEVYSILQQRKIELKEKKASPTQDLLSQMLTAIEGKPDFADQEYLISDQIVGMLLAAHEDVSTSITSVMKFLGELPDIYEQVKIEQIEIAKSKGPGELLNWDDIKKMRNTWNVICEVMRLLPPFQGTFREALTDFTYAGFSIPKGWKLYWSTYSTHMNSECFKDPEKFDPSRFAGSGPAPYTFTPFGGGPRMCPGNEYTRLVMLVYVHNLTTKYSWRNTNANEKLIVDPTPRPSEGLPIQLQPHVILD